MKLAKLFGLMRGNLVLFISVLYLVVLVTVSLTAPWIAPFDYAEQDRSAILSAPTFHFYEHGVLSHFLGTDAVGRDLLSTLMYGGRYTLLIGGSVIVLSACVGIVIGLFAGFFGGTLDYFLMRLMDLILSFPSLLLALVLVAVLGPGLVNSTIAIAVVQLPHFVRLVRAQVMQEKKKDYFAAVKILGASRLRLMFIHLLPNCVSPIIVQSTLNFSEAILSAAALGFLGLGAQPPTPEWGTMLADAREFIFKAWWVAFFPGLAILITVLAINILGDSLRDKLDPRLKKA